MAAQTAGFPAPPEHAEFAAKPSAGIAHGLTVTLPGGHRCAVYTSTDDDAETIRDMVRHNGCQAALFDYTPTTNGAFSR